MNEAHSWFRTESSRKANDLEAMSAPLFSKGQVKVYTCKLLNQECRYVPNTGAGDCRHCIFALTFLSSNPQYAKDNIRMEL